jgi:GGDEF domain-containing protein
MARFPPEFVGTPLGNAFERLRARRVTEARETAITAHDLALACDDDDAAALAALALAQADYQDAAFASSIRRALDVQARAEALDDARLGVEAALALGSGFWRIGDSETALSVIENEIDRAFRLGDRELLAALHRVLGVTLSEIGGHVAGWRHRARLRLRARERRAAGDLRVRELLGGASAHLPKRRPRREGGRARQCRGHDPTSLDVASRRATCRRSPPRNEPGAVIIERGDWVEDAVAARALEKTRRRATFPRARRWRASPSATGARALDAALASLEQAYAIAATQQAKPLLRRVHLQISQTLERAGRYGDALTHYKRHHALEREIAADIAEQRARMSGLRLDRERARREADQFRAETRELTDAVERDSLTGIGNRRAFDRALGALLSQGDARCTLALIDCDHFKAVNDRASHLAGDRVPQRIAKVLTQRRARATSLHGSGTSSRRFRRCRPHEAANVCERIRAAIEQYADGACRHRQHRRRGGCPGRHRREVDRSRR